MSHFVGYFANKYTCLHIFLQKNGQTYLLQHDGMGIVLTWKCRYNHAFYEVSVDKRRRKVNQLTYSILGPWNARVQPFVCHKTRTSLYSCKKIRIKFIVNFSKISTIFIKHNFSIIDKCFLHLSEFLFLFLYIANWANVYVISHNIKSHIRCTWMKLTWNMWNET